MYEEWSLDGDCVKPGGRGSDGDGPGGCDNLSNGRPNIPGSLEGDPLSTSRLQIEGSWRLAGDG